MCPVCSSELPSLVLCDNPLQHTTSHLQTNGNPPHHADHTPAACFWLLLWPATHHIQTGEGSCTRGAAAKQRKLLGSLRRCNGPSYPPDPQTLPACLCPSLPSIHQSIHPSIHPFVHASSQPSTHPPIRPPSFLPPHSLPPLAPSFPAAPSQQLHAHIPLASAPTREPPPSSSQGERKETSPQLLPVPTGRGSVIGWIGSASSQAGRQAGGQGRAGQCRAWHGRREGGREAGRGREGARTRPDGPKERRRRCPNARPNDSPRSCGETTRTDGKASLAECLYWVISNNGLHALWVRSRRADAQSSSRLAPSSPLRRRRP